MVTFWIDAAAPSVSTVWQKLLPLLPVPPGRLNRVAVVPSGGDRRNTRSPTQVWSTPPVVEPMSALQVAPSMLKATLETPLAKATGSWMFTPAGFESGIGTTGPVYAKCVGGLLARPGCTEKLKVAVRPPLNVTVSVNGRTAPHTALGLTKNANGVLFLVPVLSAPTLG